MEVQYLVTGALAGVIVILVQALAAFINIQLPYQKAPDPIISSTTPSLHGMPRHEMAGHLRPGGGPFPGGHASAQAQRELLRKYIRRLIATGHDSPGVLHGFFGDDWLAGVGPLHEMERQNYLFAAKSESWLRVKQSYDLGPEETVPFLIPLRTISEQELVAADQAWSEWLEMQDWVLGPRAPDGNRMGGAQRAGSQAVPVVPKVKREIVD